MKNRTIVFLLLPALAACAPVGTGDSAAARRSLLEADRAWSGTVQDRDAFLSRLASDVHLLPPDEPRIQGAEAFRSHLDQLLGSPGARLTWSPDLAGVSGSGDLGYTIGSFELTMAGSDGEPVIRPGKYVTVWERHEDGSWKVVADTFNFDAPMPAARADGAARSGP